MTSLASSLPAPSAPRPAAARRWGTAELLTAVAVLTALVLMTPVLTIVWTLLQPIGPLWGHLIDTVLPTYLANTFWLALVVGCGSLFVGVGAAALVTFCDFPGRRLLEWGLVLPLAIPAYVMAYAYSDLLSYAGAVQASLRDLFGWQSPADYWFPNVFTVWGAGAMLLLSLFPYIYLLTRAAFLQQSVCVLEVGRTLGLGPGAVFFRIALPLARPAAVAGLSLVLMETLADFGTVSFLGVQTFTTGIYRAWFSFYDRVTAAQLAALLLGAVFTVLLLERLSRGQRRYHHTSQRYSHLQPQRLRGWRAGLALAVCILPVFAGFLLPAGLLLSMALRLGFDPLSFLPEAVNSFVLGGTGALAAVVLALVFAYAARLAPGPVTLTTNRLASLGYAVPGSVIAVGLLLPAGALDNAVDAWSRGTFGVSTGLLLTGSIAALVIGYLVRFLAVSLQAVEAGLAKVRPSLEDAGRSLGRGPGNLLFSLHTPLLSGSLATGGLLVFVDILKELPATLIMRPFNFDTLAIRAHNYASDERLAHAATPSLMIVAVALLPVLLLCRSIARSRPGAAATRS